MGRGRQEMNEPAWVGRWRSSAVTKGVCVYVHTNPATHVGTVTDWIGGPSRTLFAYSTP